MKLLGTDFGGAPMDVRDLLGMRRPEALAVAAAFVVGFSTVALSNLAGVSNQVPVITSVICVAAACVAILTVRGDPLPRWKAMTISSVAPLSCVLILGQLEPAGWSMNQVWNLRATTAVLAYLSVRGRVGFAFTGSVVSCGVCIWWTTTTEQGPLAGLDLYSVNFGPILMSVVFAFSVRPVATLVYSLRHREAEEAADEAKSRAAIFERDLQLARIRDVAGGLLLQAGTGVELSSEQRTSCRIAEATLRDIVRAPRIAEDEKVSAAVQRARRCGATVMLLDDREDRDAPLEIPEFIDHILQSAEGLRPGCVMTVRVLPLGRSDRATIVTTDPSQRVSTRTRL